MTIARRLILLVAVPLLVLIGLGVFSAMQLDSIGGNSQFLAEIQVPSLAVIGDAARSIAEMRVNVRSFVLAEDKGAQQRAQTLFRADKEQLDKGLTRYADGFITGDRDRRLFTDFRTLSTEWSSEAEKVMAMAAAGRLQEATAVLVSGRLIELGERLSKVSTEWIQHNEVLAEDAGKANLEAINDARRNLRISVVGSLLLTGLLGFFTFGRIVRPIRALQGSVEAIASGDFVKPVPFTEAKDETGGLARSVDVLKQGAAAMEEQRWIKANTARLMEQLQRASSYAEFGERLLSGLVPAVGGGAAGFYLMDQSSELLRRAAGYGLDASAGSADSFGLGAGLVGQCARARTTTMVSDLPPNYLRISSGVGGAAPVQTGAWPLMSREAVLGVVEIASFRAFHASEKALLEEALPAVAMSLQILSRNIATQELLAQTQEQARQLEEQTEELTQSQEELLAQKEELLTQQEELTAQREMLKVSEERSRLILESSAEGIFGTDTEGRITFVNPAACQMLGFTAEELLGQPSHTTFHHHRPDGSEYAKDECPMFLAYTHGKSSRVDDEFLWQKNGNGLPVEYGATPVLKDGVVVGAVVSFTDTTDRRLAEQRLRETEQFFRSVLELAPDALMVVDAKGAIQLTNAQGEKLFGYTRDELIGQPVEMLVPADVRAGHAGLRADFHRAPATRAMGAGRELRGLRKDGSDFPVEIGLSPIPGRNSEAPQVAVSIRDITERKRAEAELQHINFLADSALELTKAGYWHVPLDGSGWYTSSDRAVRIFGDHPSAGHRYRLDEWIAHAYEADEAAAKRMAENFESAVKGEIPVFDAIYAYKRPADGRVVWLHDLGHVVRDSKGVPVEMLGVVQDINEQKLAQDDLQQRKEELQRINFLADSALDLTRAGYWHVPLEGSGWYNSSERAVRIFGDHPTPDFRYTLEHWIEHVRLGDEAAAQVTFENFQAAIEGKIPVYDAIYAYKRPVDGRVVWIHALGRVVKDERGRPTDMFGVTQDITDFKMLEMELVGAREKAEEATAAKSMFLANMSHEIRTPMNAIIGMTHLALKTDLTAKQRDYLAKVRGAAGALLGIINDILDFSKIEAGRLDLEESDFSFEDVLTNLSTVVGQKAMEKNIEFLISAQPDIPANLVGDPLRLGQILINLVNNAVKFTECGEVLVRAGVEEQVSGRVKLKFSVRDTGIGMTPEQSARLFQAFSQADTSTTRKFGGTGLGLSISKRLVEMMGGEIWVESEAGVGSTFSFTAWFGVGSVDSERKRFVPDLAGIRALVVDDNAQAREILGDALRAFALRVDAVSSAEAAIRELISADSIDPYALVLMDWHMPGMDGIQASAVIKRDLRLKKPPCIVMVTAFGREEVRAQAEDIGIEGYLLKPVNASVLFDTLMEMFGSARTEDSRSPHRREQATEYNARGIRVLLVEDNEMNQQVATELLESAGAGVTIANHGGIAVKLLTEGAQPPPFDIVLMDLQMPEMDGYTATRLLRADSRFHDLPIVAMTAHALVEERQRCLDAGMNDHVTKPIDPDALFAALARWTKQRSAAPAEPAIPAPEGAGPALPEIDGVDIAGGLKRVAGNKKLYRSLLEQFVSKEAGAASGIAQALQAGDRAVAERQAHTLKGVAGNIGIGDVQSAAEELEKAIRAGDASAPSLLGDLESVLIPRVAAIRTALSETASEPTSVGVFDANLAAAAVARLNTLLEANDGDAADVVQQVASALTGQVDTSRLAALRDSVDEFDFDDAKAKLAEIAKECNLVL